MSGHRLIAREACILKNPVGQREAGYEGALTEYAAAFVA
jgi:hypothetical protein